MKILVEYGEGLGADRLLEVDDVTCCVPCPYPTHANAEIEFDSMNALFSWANLCSEKTIDEIPKVKSRRCTSLCGTNPSKEYLEYIGFTDKRYIDGVDATRAFFREIGVNNTLTCTPHLVGHLPSKGEHCVCAESSQVIFLNSVFGARVNCQGLVAAACAAMVRRIPNFGMHIDENRHGTHLVKVEKIPQELYEWDLMGLYIGKRVGIGVPVLEMKAPFVTMDQHKSLGASMTTTGQVDLYHIIGLTPEAGTYELAFGPNTPKETIVYGAEQEEEMRREMDWATDENVDMVLLGCPNYSIFQLRDVAEMLDGKKCKSKLVVMAARMLVDQARVNGDAQIIEAAGGFLMTDSCPPMIKMWPDGVKVLATDSGKMAYYVPGSRPDVQIHMGSMRRCIDAAVTGKW
jgi:hypothetical protein